MLPSPGSVRSFLSRPVPKVRRKIHLLTKDGMLKILCLDVEVLLGKLLEFAEQCICKLQKER